ncbi:MAG: hypothetical protein HY746_03965 [Elusimicrobia bacterium]|nr:hypothetical protein [Elusimicrobiota bacterium]
MSVAIREIEDRNLSEFIDFPYNLFKKDPFWVGDLKRDAAHLLSRKHPFWNHAERKLFIAFKDSKPAGRVAAITNSLHNSLHNDKCGFFGFFDCIDDAGVSKALFTKVFSFLKEKGMNAVRGPVNPSTNETCGFLIEGFNSPPVIMMPYNPPYYLKLAEDAGFKKAKDLYAFKRFSADVFSRRFEKIVSRILKDGQVKIEPADMKNLDKELEDFREIYNDAWEENWGFAPITKEELEETARALKPLLKPDYLFFVRVGDERPGFCLFLPDFNIPLKIVRGKLTPLNFLPFIYKMLRIDKGRVLALGVKKSHRNRGLEILLIKEAIMMARRMKWEYGELSWTLEDNDRINKTIELVGGHVYKKYRIYEKEL